MTYSTAVAELVRQRYSCRIYQKSSIENDLQKELTSFLSARETGPFGSRARFRLLAATESDRDSLRGLGTYGFTKDATGFIAGVVQRAPKDMEDFGFLMEQIILKATDLGLGSCWLGGSFKKSAFASRIERSTDESMPAVAAVGKSENGCKDEDWIRRRAGAENRLPFEELFFDGSFSTPLTREDAGAHAVSLEAVRLGPSASNRQPWRVVRTGRGWHFYLRRSHGYGRGTLLFKVLRLADLQRVDMGIAMCHFELTAREAGIKGNWLLADPRIEGADLGMEYTATWFSS